MLWSFIAVCLSAWLFVDASYRGPAWQRWVFKPLTLLLLALLAWQAPMFNAISYLVLAGLLASLLGDALTLLPRQRLLYAVGAFFLSHLLYTIYFAMTSLEVVLLKLAGMPLYDAFIHAFSTAGTGGFSNRNASVGAYGSPVIDMIIAVFALLFSVNFSVYFLVLHRRLKEALKSDELRFFLGVVAAATVVITLDLLPIYQNTLESLRYAFFQVASIISTTGFATADYVLWPQLSRLVLVLLMFCGACAGSTGGGIKCSRVLMLLRAIRREIHQIAHPRSVEVVKLDGKVAEESTVHSVLVFVGCYGLILLGAALVVSLDKMPFDVSFSAALTCLSNVGPGLAAIGPTGNFSGFSDLSKLALSLCMIVGRLEIFPILVMFSARTWRRD